MIDFYKDLKKSKTPKIIAEIGAKYGGMKNVLKSIKVSKDIGVDYVKFQTYKAKTIASKNSFFNIKNKKISQYDFFKEHELSMSDHIKIDELCKKLGIGWSSTPSHVTDLDILNKFQLPFLKIGSDDVTNLPFLKYLGKTQKPILLSTGMCTLSEIEDALKTLTSTGNKKIILLHCVVDYPSKIEDANLKMIDTLKSNFGFLVGLSDHTQNEFTSILATQLGVKIIEKHFTLDHSLCLPDHEASLDPNEFKKLIDSVKLVNIALGNGKKRILNSEKKWRKAARKSIFASKNILKGEVINEKNIEIKRPSDGIHPKYYKIILGRKAKTNIKANTLITWKQI